MTHTLNVLAVMHIDNIKNLGLCEIVYPSVEQQVSQVKTMGQI